MFRALSLILLFVLPVVAKAQMYNPEASEVTPARAQELFKILQQDHQHMSKFSECFERNHLWSHLLERKHGVITENAYIFFTFKFSMAHDVRTRWGRPITWWFHVAPAVRVNGSLWVMDATFTDRAMPLQQWARSVMKQPEDCAPLYRYADFEADRSVTNGYQNTSLAQEQCYYTGTPRYFFQPLDVEWIEEGKMEEPKEWRSWTLKRALDAYSDGGHRRAVKREMGI